ncbi:MAG: type II secretion system F family protein [Aquificota bacterium]|nr:MAG: type II secretion system F family protein [Aquificota bacterium]
MPKFKYEARDNYGVLKKGIIKAYSIHEVEDLLKEQGLKEIKIHLIETEKSKKAKKKGGISLFGGGKVKEKDLAVFTRQLGAMISAGIGISEALEIIAEQTPNKTLSDALFKVRDDVLSGTSLSKSMEKFPKVFPNFLVNLIASAEESGNLDIILQRATVYYEKIAAIKRKLISASWYPTAVLIIASLIVIGILTFIVPTFAQMYAGMGAHLPLLTQMLINASNALRENALYIIVFVFAFFGINSYFYKTPAGKKIYHRIMLKLPLLGQIFLKGAIAKFARTFATLTAGGVPIMRALEISSKVVGNVIIEDAILEAKNDVEQGKALWTSLDSDLFPSIFISMLKVGEETGRIDEMLDTIAEFFEDEVDRAIDGLLSTIEPLLMVFIGGIVGIIIIALYLPIFKMGELIGR